MCIMFLLAKKTPILCHDAPPCFYSKVKNKHWLSKDILCILLTED